MEKSELITLRMFAFQNAMQFRIYVVDGEEFVNEDFNVYEKSEEILSYILNGSFPDNELGDLLN